MRDLSCVASDGSNVITTTTTSDDAECGGKLTMYLSSDVTIGNDVWNKLPRCSSVAIGI